MQQRTLQIGIAGLVIFLACALLLAVVTDRKGVHSINMSGSELESQPVLSFIVDGLTNGGKIYDSLQCDGSKCQWSVPATIAGQAWRILALSAQYGKHPDDRLRESIERQFFILKTVIPSPSNPALSVNLHQLFNAFETTKNLEILKVALGASEWNLYLEKTQRTHGYYSVRPGMLNATLAKQFFQAAAIITQYPAEAGIVLEGLDLKERTAQFLEAGKRALTAAEMRDDDAISPFSDQPEITDSSCYTAWARDEGLRLVRDLYQNDQTHFFNAARLGSRTDEELSKFGTSQNLIPCLLTLLGPDAAAKDASDIVKKITDYIVKVSYDSPDNKKCRGDGGFFVGLTATNCDYRSKVVAENAWAALLLVQMGK